MRNFILLLLLCTPIYAFTANEVDTVEETTILLKNRNSVDVIPFLKPHLLKDGRITGQDKNITIKSRRSNIIELLTIIGDLDKKDYKQLIISISMNMQAAHNVNTRNIQVGANTWTKINFGRTYSRRVRETLPDGRLVEKIKNVKVTESIQIYTEIDETNKNIVLKLRIADDDTLDSEELADENLTVKLVGKINKWISLADAINSLYLSNDEDGKITIERQRLTNKLGIKVQLLQ